MLAAVYHGPQDLRVEKIPVPQVGPDELLLQVKSASICGTDLRIFHGGHRMFPAGTVRVPGHEVVGVISNLGSEVDGLTVGQTVFIAPNMGCGHCQQCISGNNNRCASYQALGVTIDGGFAEYMRVPAAAIKGGNVMPINETVDTAVAALIEPFACVLRGQDVLNIIPGDIVLVIGAGPIGIMHAKLAQLRGAGKVLVSETNPERAAQALTLGADRVINPDLEDLSAVIADESAGTGANVIIVAAPAHAAQEAALQLAAIGGRINFFGGLPKNCSSINFDSNLVHYKELLVTATTACSTSDCRRSAQIISTGKVDLSSLVSKRFPLTAALLAFAAAEDRKSLKVVLEP